MLIWVLTPDLQRVDAIESFSSFIITKNYQMPSSFELHLAMDEQILKMIQEKQLAIGQILLKDNENEGYLIEEMSISYQEIGGELTLKGRDLRAYLERRIIWGEKAQSNYPHLLIQDWFRENVISPSHSVRRMKQFVLGEMPQFSNKLSVEVAYDNLLEMISSICELTDSGFKILVDLERKQFVFEMYQGKDRTSEQSQYPSAIFSKEFENLEAQEVVLDDMDARTTAVLTYERDDVSKLLEVSDGASDYLRRKIYVDAKSIGKGSKDEPVSEGEQKLLVQQKGLDELQKYISIETMEADVFTNGNLRYQEDFDLGDKVTVLSQPLGMRLDTRIVSVEEVYEQKGVEIRLTFGNKIPTLVDKIKRKVK